MKFISVVLFLVLVVITSQGKLVYGALDDASFQKCWTQLIVRTLGPGGDPHLLDNIKNSTEHDLLKGNVTIGTGLLGSEATQFRENLYTCMQTGVLP